MAAIDRVVTCQGGGGSCMTTPHDRRVESEYQNNVVR